jgi:hypothetical protein
MPGPPLHEEVVEEIDWATEVCGLDVHLQGEISERVLWNVHRNGDPSCFAVRVRSSPPGATATSVRTASCCSATRGQIRYEVLIDHAGTPDDPSDDVFLEDLGILKGPTGRNDTIGRDFCEALTAIIGP